METLTNIAKNKLAKSFYDEVNYASYIIDGELKTTKEIVKTIDENKVQIILSLSNEDKGNIDNLEFLNSKGEVIIKSPKEYINSQYSYDRGLAVVFKYSFNEVVTSF